MNLGITLTLLVIVIFIGGIYLTIYLTEKIMKIYIPDILGGIIIFIWAISIIVKANEIYDDYASSLLVETQEHEFYIYSLGNDKYMEGDIGLFTGSINETDYYFFYVNYENGMFREKLRVDECYIIEGDYKIPQIKSVYKTYNDENKFWKVWDDALPKHYIIYVPKGTIIRDFKIR